MMTNTINLNKLIQTALYSSADLNSQIPDVDQMAEFLYINLSISKITLEDFSFEFIKLLSDSAILEKCFYPQIISSLENIIYNLEKNEQKISICAWTQGNVFLQTQKALIFQKYISEKYLAKPSIYASLEKVSILPMIYKDLTEQNCDLICVIDDRSQNILSAYNILEGKGLFIHKIRPDKQNIQRVSLQRENILELSEWSELENILLNSSAKQIGLVLDKDGIILNTTLYRQILHKTLIDWVRLFQ